MFTILLDHDDQRMIAMNWDGICYDASLFSPRIQYRSFYRHTTIVAHRLGVSQSLVACSQQVQNGERCAFIASLSQATLNLVTNAALVIWSAAVLQ